MELEALVERAWEVRQKYAAFEQARFGKSWSREEIALGFVGDVGDLMKLVMAKEGAREIPDTDAGLAHELADCLWAILVLSRAYGVDLQAAFLETMEGIERHLKNNP